MENFNKYMPAEDDAFLVETLEAGEAAAAFGTVQCISKLLGVEDHGNVMAYFDKNLEKFNYPSTVDALLDKFKESLQPDDESRRMNYYENMRDRCEYMERVEAVREGVPVHGIPVHAEYFLLRLPVRIVREIIDGYYGKEIGDYRTEEEKLEDEEYEENVETSEYETSEYESSEYETSCDEENV